MKDQPLSAVNQKLIDAGAFLKDLASEHSKLDCLETFSKCLGVVRWIRSETKGQKLHVQYTVCFYRND